jgi:hypothetical protein
MLGFKVKFIRSLTRPQCRFQRFILARGGFEFWSYRGGPALYVWRPK